MSISQLTIEQSPLTGELTVVDLLGQAIKVERKGVDLYEVTDHDEVIRFDSARRAQVFVLGLLTQQVNSAVVMSICRIELTGRRREREAAG